MRKSINIKEVAKIAGVSVASVSRALQETPSPFLSAAQRQRIRDICEELHYFPDVHTKRMFSKKSNNIALFSRTAAIHLKNFRRLMDYNFGAVIIGIQSVLVQKGINLQLIEVSDSVLQSKSYLKMVRSKMFDGIFSWGELTSDTYSRDIVGEDIPIIMLTTKYDHSEIPSVIADEYSGMKCVVEQVLNAGHRRIALFQPTTLASSGVQRKKAILDTLETYGVVPVWVSPDTGFDYNFGRRTAERMLNENVDVTAVIASNDMVAWGCIDEMAARGIQVPESVSISGADGNFMPGPKQIASFYLPSYEIGVRGAELICDMIENGGSPKSEILPVTQIPGNTITTIQGKEFIREKSPVCEL